MTDVVMGAAAITALQPALVELSLRCDQRGAMDHLPYFLSWASALKKKPYLILLGTTWEQALASPARLQGALLIFEYRLFGFGTRLFATDDTTGRRTLVAPPASRSQAARLAVETLMRLGAQSVLITVAESHGDGEDRTYLEPERGQAAPIEPVTTWRAATRSREIPSYLPLEASYDATLARIGQRTRSNLRYYRRRAEAQLGARFVAAVEIERADFLNFNRNCAFTVDDQLANWRFDAIPSTPGMFLAGVRGGDGGWLSLVCGRRFHDMVEIDWQMNRADLPAASLGTVMRAYLIEHEIGLGMRQLYIEGGTPHAMRHSFVVEPVRDLLVLRRSGLVPLLRRVAARFLPKTNFLLDVLSEPGLTWRPWR